jgi:LppX/LprAFG-like lipoprotein
MGPVSARIVAAGVTAATSIGLTGAAALTFSAPGAAGAATAATAAAAPSAQAEYEAALKAAGRKGVHFESLLSQGGVTIQVSGDSGATSGAQTITVKRGTLTEHVKAMVVDKTGYISANATALRYVVGLSGAQASKYANKWLYFPTSNAGLAELVAGLENAQVASELQMTGPFTYGHTTTVQGKRVRAIRGYVTSETGSKVRVVLYVSASGTPTPIQEVTNPGAATGSSVVHGTVTLSNWGQQVTQTAPSHAVSLLKLNPPSTSGATSTTAG